MPSITKSLIHLKSALLSLAVLSTSSSVNAEIGGIKRSSSLHAKNSSKIVPNKTKIQFKTPRADFPNASNGENYNLATDSAETGVPSLRRQPSGGQRFEPQRIPLQIPIPKQPYRASPSITIINPSAYGASWGNAGIGFGFQERVRFRDAADGVIGLGFGLGNPVRSVGAQVGISLVDVSAPFRDGAINLKLHRRLPQDFSVAIGVQGLTTWGDTDGGSSVYGVTTKRLRLRQDRTKPFSELYTTLGVGGGQFRSEFNITNGIDNPGIFGSLAVKVSQPIGLVAEWTGQDLTLGVPLVPFRKLPIVLVPAITDVTGSAGDGTRLIFGFGYTYSFK